MARKARAIAERAGYVRPPADSVWGLAARPGLLQFYVINVGFNPGTWFVPAFAVVQYGTTLAILVRFGVLPMAVAVWLQEVIRNAPLTTDFSVWYASVMFVCIAVVLTVAIWSFRTASVRARY